MYSDSQEHSEAAQVPATRGVRNNNPLNIRIGNSWLGETAENTDGVFEQFRAMVYGLRAAFVLVKRYILRYALDTIAKIVGRWAPEAPALLQMYIDYVARSSRISSTAKVRWDSRDVLAIVRAMAYFESHYVPTEAELIEAYKLAGGHLADDTEVVEISP